MFTPIRSHAVGLGFKIRRLMPIHYSFLTVSAQGAGHNSGLDVVYMQMTASCHLAGLNLTAPPMRLERCLSQCCLPATVAYDIT